MSSSAAALSAGPFTTPVVLFVFNRPNCTARVLERIRSVRPQRLYVVADGARANHPEDAERCSAVRTMVTRGVDWSCDLRTDFAPYNLGCARRVSSGLNWVFTHTEEAVILEDDCVPDPTFFPFCVELLQRYRDEQRVAQISGCTFRGPTPVVGPSYYFSRYPHCWGWATWRRAWRYYDHSMQAWSAAGAGKWLAEWIDNPAERRVFANRFDGVVEGRIDSWAYRWLATIWHHGWLNISPCRNLVSNIGFGADATHTRRTNRAADVELSSLPFPLIHPVSLARDAAADEVTSRLLFRPPSLGARLRRRVHALFR